MAPDFAIARLRTAGIDEDSWVSMAFDPEGRLTTAREEKGLIRLNFDNANNVTTVELIGNLLIGNLIC
jgi:hypothetical protein